MTMLRQPNSALIVDVNNASDTWCVFDHQAVMKEGEPPETIFVGVDRLSQIYRLGAARNNSEWTRIFGNGGQVLVQIVATTTDKAEAYRFAQERIVSLSPMPICNANGRSLRSGRRVIMCHQNRKQYPSQTEAAADLGIYASAISRHMSGYAASAQGFTFSFVDPADAL